jgi:hypothetical protein
MTNNAERRVRYRERKLLGSVALRGNIQSVLTSTVTLDALVPILSSYNERGSGSVELSSKFVPKYTLPIAAVLNTDILTSNISTA